MLSEVKNNWRRTLVYCCILLGIMVKSGQFNATSWLLADRILIYFLYASFVVLPKKQWNLKRLVVTSILISVLVFISLLLQNNKVSIFMMIVLTLPASYVFERLAYFYYVSVVLLEMCLFLTVFEHQSYLQSLPLIILLICITLAFRARINRQEAYRLSQLHLKELEKAHRELQEAAVSTMQYAVLDERTRIAREIHDALGHSLTSLIIQLQALRYMIEVDPNQAKQSVEDILTVARQGLNDIRVSVHALAVDQSALGIAPLQALISRINATTDLNCTFSADKVTNELPEQMGSVLFKVLQEAMTNILRHSQATRVHVEVSITGEECRMTIQDNGRLTEVNRLVEGFGLKSMRERVYEVGGKIEFRTGNPSGLILLTTLPFQKGTQEFKGE